MTATIVTMIVVSDVDFASQENVVADLDVVDAADMDVLAETHIVTDDELRFEMLLPVRGDGFHPESSPR